LTAKRIDAEIVPLAENKSRRCALPCATRVRDNYYLFIHHDSKSAEPQGILKPDGALRAMVGSSPLTPDRSTAVNIPRLTRAGSAPSLIRLSDTRALALDNRWLIYNWLGEPDVQLLRGSELVAVLIGACYVMIDCSGEKPVFGIPKVIQALHYPVVSSYDTPVVLADGSVLCPVDYDSYCTQIGDKPWETVILKSDKDCSNWELYAEIFMQKDNPDMPPMCRPSVKRAADGSLICAMLGADERQQIYISVSNNEGKTWSAPSPTGFSGTTHSLIPLADGRLLIAYTDQNAQFGIFIRISEDSGLTWLDSECRLLDDSSTSSDCGWTRGFQLDDGSVFLSYYVSGKKTHTAVLGAVFKV
jgi:hypothetical protein